MKGRGAAWVHFLPGLKVLKVYFQAKPAGGGGGQHTDN